jgi:hypothetical protein
MVDLTRIWNYISAYGEEWLGWLLLAAFALNGWFWL